MATMKITLSVIWQHTQLVPSIIFQLSTPHLSPWFVPPFIHQRSTYLIAWAECPLHVMQAICHGVDGINDKPHLSVLCILLPKRLSLCRGGWVESGEGMERERQVYQRNSSFLVS